jgi:hypothetical protein
MNDNFWRSDSNLGAPLGMFLFPMGFFLLAIITPMSFGFMVYFCMAYFWDMALRSEKLYERVQSPAYRFSFVRIIFQFHELLKKLPLLFKMEWSVRILAPTLVGCAYTLFISEWAFIPCFLGAAASELLFASLEAIGQSRRFYK